MGFFVLVLALVILVFHWIVGDQEVKTKIVVTLTWLATWLLLLVDMWAVIAVQCFSLVVGTMTFGAGWASRR